MTAKSKAMGSIRRKLNRVIGLFATACGHEGPMARACYEQNELERMIEQAIDQASATPPPQSGTEVVSFKP